MRLDEPRTNRAQPVSGGPRFSESPSPILEAGAALSPGEVAKWARTPSVEQRISGRLEAHSQTVGHLLRAFSLFPPWLLEGAFVSEPALTVPSPLLQVPDESRQDTCLLLNASWCCGVCSLVVGPETGWVRPRKSRSNAPSSSPWGEGESLLAPFRKKEGSELGKDSDWSRTSSDSGFRLPKSAGQRWERNCGLPNVVYRIGWNL